MLPFRLFLHFTLAIGIWLILLSAITTIGSLFIADRLFFTAAAVISTPLVILGGLMVYSNLLALKENATYAAATLPANSTARYPRAPAANFATPANRHQITGIRLRPHDDTGPCRAVRTPPS